MSEVYLTNIFPKKNYSIFVLNHFSSKNVFLNTYFSSLEGLFKFFLLLFSQYRDNFVVFGSDVRILGQNFEGLRDKRSSLLLI